MIVILSGVSDPPLNPVRFTSATLRALGNALTRQTASVTFGFTRAPNGNLISMRTGTGTNSYIVDALGSVIDLTDPTGADAATYTYDP